MRIIGKLFVAFTPLVLTCLVAWLTMEGHLNLGGGCKDAFIVLPLLIWSLVFFVCYLVLWWRGSTFRRLVVTSSVVATAVVVAAWIMLSAGSLFLLPRWA